MALVKLPTSQAELIAQRLNCSRIQTNDIMQCLGYIHWRCERFRDESVFSVRGCLFRYKYLPPKLSPRIELCVRGRGCSVVCFSVGVCEYGRTQCILVNARERFPIHIFIFRDLVKASGKQEKYKVNFGPVIDRQFVQGPPRETMKNRDYMSYQVTKKFIPTTGRPTSKPVF